jgi:hypothetical protein
MAAGINNKDPAAITNNPIIIPDFNPVLLRIHEAGIATIT